jgi:hypothetical protein
MSWALDRRENILELSVRVRRDSLQAMDANGGERCPLNFRTDLRTDLVLM